MLSGGSVKYQVGDEVKLLIIDDVDGRGLNDNIRQSTTPYIGRVRRVSSGQIQEYLIHFNQPVMYYMAPTNKLWITGKRLELVNTKTQLKLEVDI